MPRKKTSKQKIASTRPKAVSQAARSRAKKHLGGFEDFLRDQGVVALGVGFILGVAVKDFVNTFIAGIVNPIIGELLGNAKGLNSMTVKVGHMVFQVGTVVNSAINLVVIALVVYFFVKILRFDRLDKKSS